MNKLYIILILIILLIGCNAKHCIKYNNDIYGDFEYCFDATKSKIEKTPVWTDLTKDESIIGVKPGFLDKIGDLLGDILKPSTLNYKEKTYSKPPIIESRVNKINRLIKETQRRGIKIRENK